MPSKILEGRCLAVLVSGASDSWSWSCKFEPHVAYRDDLKINIFKKKILGGIVNHLAIIPVLFSLRFFKLISF